MFFDPLYMLFAAPGVLFSMYANYRVKSSFNRWSEVATSRGYSGAQIAEEILRVSGVRGVQIEPVDGFLSDHYDPSTRTLRLSPNVFHGRSVAAAGVAAHEVGHAIQHAEGYAWLQLRSQLVPVVSITSNLAMPAIMGGFLLMSFGSVALGQLAVQLGALLFAGLVVFQLVTLPVEFDASRRALLAIERGGLVSASEHDGAADVLGAAAMTYVAAAVSSALTLMYYLYRAGLIGRSDED